MTYRYLSEARQELDRQIGDYERKVFGLGLEFLNEVRSAIDRVIANPNAWSQIAPGIRRCLTHRFPFAVVYQYRGKDQEILVVAVMHNHRKPEYWKNRI